MEKSGFCNKRSTARCLKKVAACVRPYGLPDKLEDLLRRCSTLDVDQKSSFRSKAPKQLINCSTQNQVQAKYWVFLVEICDGTSSGLQGACYQKHGQRQSGLRHHESYYRTGFSFRLEFLPRSPKFVAQVCWLQRQDFLAFRCQTYLLHLVAIMNYQSQQNSYSTAFDYGIASSAALSRSSRHDTSQPGPARYKVSFRAGCFAVWLPPVLWDRDAYMFRLAPRFHRNTNENAKGFVAI